LIFSRYTCSWPRAEAYTFSNVGKGHPDRSVAPKNAFVNSLLDKVFPMSVEARKRRKTPAGTPGVPWAWRFINESRSLPARAHWLVNARSAMSVTQLDAPTK
jgi:hypothetical protein